ncbi:MAG TPA: hypothetical protein VMS22_20345 [Candidatus Eisenbacteria bacterium]|nr:hypothetical protein [Candidatus Eisenbacteria bacterium]
MPPDDQQQGNGTLIVATLLILGLTFASYWIQSAVSESGDRSFIVWFVAAVIAVLAVGFLYYVRGGRGGTTPR